MDFNYIQSISIIRNLVINWQIQGKRMNNQKLDEMIDSVDQMITDISEEEKQDPDLFIVRESAEQLREDLTSLQHDTDE